MIFALMKDDSNGFTQFSESNKGLPTHIYIDHDSNILI